MSRRTALPGWIGLVRAELHATVDCGEQQEDVSLERLIHATARMHGTRGDRHGRGSSRCHGEWKLDQDSGWGVVELDMIQQDLLPPWTAWAFGSFQKLWSSLLGPSDAAAGSKSENHVADWSGFQLALHIRLGRLSDRFRPEFNNISTYQIGRNTTRAVAVQHVRLLGNCLYKKRISQPWG